MQKQKCPVNVSSKTSRYNNNVVNFIDLTQFYECFFFIFVGIVRQPGPVSVVLQLKPSDLQETNGINEVYGITANGLSPRWGPCDPLNPLLNTFHFYRWDSNTIVCVYYVYDIYKSKQWYCCVPSSKRKLGILIKIKKRESFWFEWNRYGPYDVTLLFLCQPTGRTSLQSGFNGFFSVHKTDGAAVTSCDGAGVARRGPTLGPQRAGPILCQHLRRDHT